MSPESLSNVAMQRSIASAINARDVPTVARLDALLEAAGRGDLASAMTLRRLAALTASLEELQERRRGGAAGSQTALEEERKALVGQVCACVLQEEEEESAP